MPVQPIRQIINPGEVEQVFTQLFKPVTVQLLQSCLLPRGNGSEAPLYLTLEQLHLTLL
jgi:hypothetical protein